MVDRKAQNAVGSSRSATIFSLKFGNRARTTIGGLRLWCSAFQSPHSPDKFGTVGDGRCLNKPTAAMQRENRMASGSKINRRGFTVHAESACPTQIPFLQSLECEREAALVNQPQAPLKARETWDAGAAFRIRSEEERNEESKL